MANYLAFDTGSVEYASFNLVMPPNWNRSTVKVKFYWMPGSDSGSVGETVEWAIMGGAINDTNGTFDVALGTPQVISDAVKTGESAVVHISGATPAITIGNVAPGPGVDDLVRLKVYRNVGGTDNFGYDAFLLGVLIQYTKGTTSNTAW
jgi:hypothetical protein